tara:strand:- start:437 stop:583 length:147 start_codon:yes stop_codon:yes gene_type:complete
MMIASAKAVILEDVKLYPIIPEYSQDPLDLLDNKSQAIEYACKFLEDY